MENLAARAIQVTDLREDIDGTLRKTTKGELLKILRRGREIGILMRPEAYRELENQIHSLQDRLEGLEETLAILSDKKFTASLKKSLAQIKKGKFKTWEEAFGEPL